MQFGDRSAHVFLTNEKWNGEQHPSHVISIKMVRIVLILCIVINASCIAQPRSEIKTDFIRIEHSGPIDKPIIPLILTKVELKLPNTELPVLVSKEVFELFESYIRESSDVSRQKEVNEFGVFRVTKFVAGQRTEYFLPTRIKSIHFLKDIKAKLSNKTSAEALIKELDYILSRIYKP